MQKINTVIKVLSVSCSALLLNGCFGQNMQDLQSFVEEVKSRPATPIEPIPSIKQVDTYVYENSSRRSPFENEIVTETYTEEITGPGVHPDLLRHKEELEAYPLDTLKMVGTVKLKDTNWALVQNQGSVIFRVKPGNYMGINHGQVTRITEEKIDLTEIVPDRRGGYIERSATVALGDE